MKIAIDAGHGLGTAGKRTFVFEGSFMHEHEFNREVANYLAQELSKHQVIFTHWTYGDLDRSLFDRCKIANDFNADLFVSIHANAAKCETWHEANGVETYYYSNSIEGKKLASCIQENVVNELERNDRGIHPKRYYVLQHTNMPAVLVECGFMTNKAESRLLIYNNFRRAMAICISRAINEYIKPKKWTYSKKGKIDIIELDPNILQTMLTKKTNRLLANTNFVTGMFTCGGKVCDTLIQDGKYLARKVWWTKAKGTFIIYNDGSVEIKTVRKIKDISNIKIAFQGFNLNYEANGSNCLYNSVLAEGFLADVMRWCQRSGVGFNPVLNKVIIISAETTGAGMRLIMRDAGCIDDNGDTIAICEDSGAQFGLAVNGELKYGNADVRQYHILSWED